MKRAFLILRPLQKVVVDQLQYDWRAAGLTDIIAFRVDQQGGVPIDDHYRGLSEQAFEGLYLFTMIAPETEERCQMRKSKHI